MSSKKEWITPFLKQCFVSAGVSLNMAGAGLVMGFTAGLLEQLKDPLSSILIDDSSGSWIAAMPGISLVVGNFIVPPIMSKYGRKSANLISVVPLIIGWILIAFANNVIWLLIARFFQGLSMGMCTALSSLLIGEYTSPNNRGPFLMTISVSIAFAVLLVHVLGSYLSWKLTAVICAGIAVVDFFIVMWSPESPSWLADHGRYEDCKKVFRWLRGDEEEFELERMIEASIIVKDAKIHKPANESLNRKLVRKLDYFKTTIVKKEFYKPIIIMVHIYSIAQWSGINLLVAYTSDLFKRLGGPDRNIPILIITLDIHRIIANIFAIYVIRKIKRRTMLFTTVGINIFALLATAAYTFYKEKYVLPFDHPLIGVILTHMLMFAVATGSLSLCFIIAGEIFPLEFKNLAAGISVVFYSGNLFASVKTVPYLLWVFGLYGTYCIYATIVSYCLMVAWIFLPETKDRTLQDIEDEFRVKRLTEVKSVQSLTSWRAHNSDRRCSIPTVV